MSDDVTPSAQTEKREQRKADKLEIDKRIQEVISLILSGLNTPRICQNLSSKYNVDERTIYRYVKSAREIIASDSEQSRDALLLEHRAHRRDLRFRARAAGDFRAELATAQDEAKLMGLYPNDKIDITHTWKERAREAGYDPEEIERQARSAVAGIIAGSDSGDAPESGDGGKQ